jgi:DNA end-binding protein Ku
LKLSLVTCPVAILPATSEAEKVRFHTLNRATGNRVHARYVDAETGKPVDDEDQVKGYEREDGRYVMLKDEELDAVALESSRTIDIDCFMPMNSIGWIRYDTPYYLVPDDKIGEEAFSVIHGAMVKSNTLAISRVVLYHRERAVLLETRGRGMVLWTLRYGDEVRGAAEHFKSSTASPSPRRRSSSPA